MAQLMRVYRLLVPAALLAALSGCAVARPSPAPGIAAELANLSGPAVTPVGPVQGEVLEGALAVDPYVCAPSPRQVFFGPVPSGAREIAGVIPHYGIYRAPLHYLVRRDAAGWRVELRVELEPPGEGELMQLPDCALAGALEGASACRPELAPSLDTDELCPESPVLTAPATPKNVALLLARWSSGVEAYFNRDAQRFGLPVHYDFEFALAPGGASRSRTDARLSLRTGCGRTPYFMGLDTGWSLPILAHETGHLLGLLDEFESVAEMLGASYASPSTLDTSRMGESRREDSQVLPLHHYLVLRRYLCPAPSSVDPFRAAIP